MKKHFFLISFVLISLSIFSQSFSLRTPNGGETFVIGNQMPIHWDTSGAVSTARLEYSIDGGTNWIVILTSTANDGDYLWTVPNAATASCRVRISDPLVPTNYDISDTFFTIQTPLIDIKKPDGGNVLRIGESYPIHWDWTGAFANVKIEYTIDDGTNWTSIVSTTANDGEYIWTVPNFPSTNCRIRITSTTDPNCFGTSGSIFEIATNTITITSPNGGEGLTTGKYYPVYWSYEGSFANVKIEYSADSGSIWTSIAATTLNDGSYYWLIPTINPSDNCLLKITNTANPACFDLSDSRFSILSTGLTLLSPNGGETFIAGSGANISWNWEGTIANVRLEYSIDGGTNWITIISSTANDGSYLWTVPNAPTNQLRVKITNVADANCFDLSNGNSTLVTSGIGVITPNGGESLIIGEEYPIHWNWTGSFVNAKIEYSINSGTSWTTIVTTTANDGSYIWTVPNAVSSLCRIRVSNVLDANANDISDTDFSIARTGITVVSPNGGENLMAGNSQAIHWTTSGTVANVNIDYSVNGGSTWTSIASNTANDGVYVWTLPNSPSVNYLVRITNASDAAAFDVSNAVFTVESAEITITSLNGGESLKIGETYPIHWTWLGNFSRIKIDYSNDGGATWFTVSANDTNDGSYNWAVPSTLLGSTQCRIRLTNISDALSTDISDADFTLLPPAITLTSLNGGEVLTAGEKAAIHWNWDGSFSNVKIEYSIDDGATYTSIVSSTSNTGDYIFTVPNTPSALCRIRVKNTSDSLNSFDVSNNTFTINRAVITLLTPDGGETFISGQVQPINWSYTGEFANVKIEYSTDDGSVWNVISNSYANEGTYSWTVPSTISSLCRVRISNAADALTWDASSSAFTISPASVTIVTPNGGENFTVGEYYPIEWTSTGSFNYVKLEYSLNNGSTWTKLTTADTTNDGSYIWQVPATAVSTQCLFRVSNNVDAANTFDVTNANFTVSSPTLTLLTPNGNDTLTIGETYPVRWSWTGVFTNVKIEYSTDNTNWNTIIASTANDGAYNWTIPSGLFTSTLTVRITSTTDVNTSDVSNNNTVTVYPAINLTSPDGGETFTSGDIIPINWTNNGTISNVKLEYSTNNGFSWNTIIASVSNTGNYSWTSPVSTSDSFRIRVSDAAAVVCADMSNNVFAVTTPIIDIATPNGGENLVVGEYSPIHWNWTGSIANVKLEYSINGGSTWKDIDLSETNDGAYVWKVPNDATTQARVRITNLADINSFDVSAANFTILKPTFTIFDPDSGKQLIQGLKYPIHWNYTGAVDSVIIELFYKVSGVVQNYFLTASTLNTGSFVFTAPNYISDTCWIKLTSTADDSIYSVSERFSIVRPEYTIVEANGGEVYYPGEPQEIIWDWVGGPDTVGIQYSSDGGINYNPIKIKEINDGNYNFIDTLFPMNSYMFRIFSAWDGAADDTSDAVFGYTDSEFEITNPDTGDTAFINEKLPIEWHSRGYIYQVDIILKNVEKAVSTNIATMSNTEKFSWLVDTLLVSNGEHGIISIYDDNTGHLYDVSDTFLFASDILITDSVKILFPNITDTLYVDESYYMTWFLDTLSGIDSVEFYYTYNGLPWYFAGVLNNIDGNTLFTVPHDAVSNSFYFYIQGFDSAGSLVASDMRGPYTVKKQELGIITPNSSKELYVGRKYNINWFMDFGTCNLAQIYYCADGSTWVPIITSTPNDGNYEWKIPNIPSNNVRIRIDDYENSAVSETSEVFIVKPQKIYLTYPIATDTFIVGRDYYVTWYNEGGVDSVQVQYSVNGGTDWTSLGVMENNRNYKWTIPNYPSSSVLVKVFDTKNSNVSVISDTFTIIKPAVTITSPNTASDWISGRGYYITWDYTGKFNNVKLTYSTNNGANWTSISNSVSNSQNYLWSLPTFDTDSAVVRVAYDTDTTIFNTSSMFEILPQTIAVTYPTLAESLVAGKAYRVSWRYDGIIDTVIIEYSTDDGVSWNSPVKVLASTRSYSFTAPNTITANGRIRVSNKNLSSSFGISQRFAIINKNIEVTSPLASESYIIGDKCMVTWDYMGGTGDSVVVAYSSNGGSSWTQLDTLAASTQYYEWTIPNVPTSEAMIQVYYLRMTSSYSNSGIFTIAPQTINILSPVSSTQWTAGKKYFIVWDNSGSFSNVDLEYSLNGGGVWQSIATTGNNKYYEWTVPNASSLTSLVRVSNSSNISVNAVSNQFAINYPMISVFSPENQDTLVIGNKRYITWQSTMGAADSVVISYSTDGGATYTPIDTVQASLKTFKWTVPNTPSSNCLVRIAGYENSSVLGFGPAFTIVPQTLNVTSQYSAESYTATARKYITWDYTGVIDTLTAEYSTDDGFSWNVISSSIPAGNQYLEWNPIPSVSSSLCRVKLTNKVRTTVNASSAQFEIIPQSINVTSPVNTDNMVVGSKYYITWTNTGTISNVVIEYSIDGGSNWTAISAGTANTKNYEWTVPDYVTASGLIRISNSANASMNDISDTFAIVPQTIEITSPVSSSSWMLTRKYGITWRNNGSIANVKLQYSLDGGAVWNPLVESTANAKYYEWTVPTTAAASSNAMINVSNASNAAVEKSSDTFEIISQNINVISPKLGDQFVVSRKYYVTWLTDGTVANVNVYYSVNNGSTWNLLSSNLANTGSYEWTVPNAVSAQCIVRVTNSANENILGESSLFSIVPQSILVNSPLAGDNWIIGRKYYLTWSNVGSIATVRLQYSYNGGTDWNLITDNLSNTGSYEWTVPNTPSVNCLVQVINYSSTDVYGTSPLFTIPSQTIDILSPISGDQYLSGNKYYITWRWNGTLSTVDIEYSLNNGTDWTYIATSATNNGYYEWTLPSANSTECLVRISNPANSLVNDVSSQFTILPQNMTITCPTSTDTFIAGRKYFLTWRTKGTFTSANLWYSTDGGVQWNTIATGETNDGSYEWTVPAIASSDSALIKIGNSAQADIFAVSDTFIITKPIVTFTSPALADSFNTTKKYFVTWTTLGSITQVNLDLSYDGGVQYTNIVANLTNAGNYEWTVPAGYSSQNCRMKLTSSSNSFIYYVSDSFRINSAAGIADAEVSKAPVAKIFNVKTSSEISFSGKEILTLEVPLLSNAEIVVYDASGRAVKTIFKGLLDKGFHQFSLNGKSDSGKNLANGIYFIRVIINGTDNQRYSKLHKIVKVN
ncbi:MAG: FlgD immunoglobulin-like domain containing protein [bacterium]